MIELIGSVHAIHVYSRVIIRDCALSFSRLFTPPFRGREDVNTLKLKKRPKK
jgi:hypothetical protein